jgi:hypothetical protein
MGKSIRCMLRRHKWGQLQGDSGRKIPPMQALREEESRHATTDTTLNILGPWLRIGPRSGILAHRLLIFLRLDVD